MGRARSAANSEIPNSGATCRNVRFVRQYVAISNTRSASGKRHGRPPLDITATATHQPHQLLELRLAQPGERLDPIRIIL